MIPTFRSLLIASLCLAPLTVAAQSASVVGQVVDESGAALSVGSGLDRVVTVSLYGSDGRHVDMTPDRSGRFAFTVGASGAPLAPGTYTVAASGGFRLQTFASVPTNTPTAIMLKLNPVLLGAVSSCSIANGMLNCQISVSRKIESITAGPATLTLLVTGDLIAPNTTAAGTATRMALATQRVVLGADGPVLTFTARVPALPAGVPVTVEFRVGYDAWHTYRVLTVPVTMPTAPVTITGNNILWGDSIIWATGSAF